jgi:hypothetical protein
MSKNVKTNVKNAFNMSVKPFLILFVVCIVLYILSGKKSLEYLTRQNIKDKGYQPYTPSLNDVYKEYFTALTGKETSDPYFAYCHWMTRNNRNHPNGSMGFGHDANNKSYFCNTTQGYNACRDECKDPNSGGGFVKGIPL